MWYRRGFAQGLLWLDEGDTDKRFREMQFIKDIERDIRDICVQDGRWQNAIIPSSFDVGLQHALKPTKTPEDDDITAPIDISDEDMTVAPMETLNRVTPMHPRRQDVRDPIRYIQVGKGLLAARPRPSLRDLESWKLSALVHRSEASEAFGRWAIESINSAGCWHICRTVGKLQLLSFFFVQKLLPLISTRSPSYKEVSPRGPSARKFRRIFADQLRVQVRRLTLDDAQQLAAK